MEFTATEWHKISSYFEANPHACGFPERREDSVLLGSFNIRKLGRVKSRPDEYWRMLAAICGRFDLLAVQEVTDNLEGIKHLKGMLPDADKYGMVVSDTTGYFPSQSNLAAERLAFLFRWDRMSRTEVASDITLDRSRVMDVLFENRKSFQDALEKHAEEVDEIKRENIERESQGKDPKPIPGVPSPHFLVFVRTPLCVSFEINADGGAPKSFLAVNCHLLYGDDPHERRREFDALLQWLIDRSRKEQQMYHPNIILFGDCNLEFDKTDISREDADDLIKRINQTGLQGETAKANFPFLDKHPDHDAPFTSTARQEDAYDQIGIFKREDWLPDHTENENAGRTGMDGYDFGVVNFVQLIGEALHGPSFEFDKKSDQGKHIIKCVEWDLSDHLPIWIRLPRA